MPNENQKIIQPRVQTPVPCARQPLAATRLPDDLLCEHVQRVAIAGAVGAGLWLFGLVMDGLVMPATLGTKPPMMMLIVDVLGVLFSAGLFAFIRHSSYASQLKADVGLMFMVANAAAVALINTQARSLTIATMGGHVSWMTIVILVGSMILPTTPRKMLAVALFSASMDPFGVWIAHLRGLAVPSMTDAFVIFMPNYACAIVAILPSHVLQRIGRRLRQAQEMGSYHLVELLGRGGMGEVWRAEHRLLARSAAIKLVRPELLGASTEAEARTMLRRFEREAQATAALSSPHTIRIFDFGVTADRTFYYVMELLDGRDLDSLVREFGPVPADRAAYLLRQVCHSLSEAQSCGLVHRDIKPANIYLCHYGEEYDFVKVLDFGIVGAVRDTPGGNVTRTGENAVRGTPAFIAPEQVTGGQVDGRADIYATGCLAYWFLTGELVFTADTQMGLLLKHVQTPPTPPSARTDRQIPPELEALVLSCLAKDPAQRPQSARELSSRLGQLQGADAWTEDRARDWWLTHAMS